MFDTRFRYFRPFLSFIDAPTGGGSAPAQDKPNSDADNPAEKSTDDTPASEASEKEIDWQKEALKWKALSRQNENQAKRNAEKAKRLDEIEESSKSELQKAQDNAVKEKQRADALEQRLMRAEIAARYGLDPDFLTGSDQEEMEDHAKRLLAWRGNDDKPASTPASDAGQRGSDIGGVEQLTRDDLKTMTPQEIEQARKAGKLKTLMGR